MSTPGGAPEETRHLWVGGIPDGMTEDDIQEYFTKFGKVEGVKILPQRYPNSGMAAFVDFQRIKDAVNVYNSSIKIKGVEVRTNYKSKIDREHSNRYYNSPERGEEKEKDKDKKKKSTPNKINSSSGSNSTPPTSSGGDSTSSSSDSDGEEETTSSTSTSDTDEYINKKKQTDINKDTTTTTIHVSTKILKVTNIHVAQQRRPETKIHEALYNKFYDYSVKPEVRLYGHEENRYALIKFKTLDESKAAYKGSQGLSIFGTKVNLTTFPKDDLPSGGRDLLHPPPLPPHAGTFSRGAPLSFNRGNPFISPGELDPSATRTLFVGNIPKKISIYELRDVFQRYGPILDVEIKKMSGNATYGFILFFDLLNAVNAKKGMDGVQLGGNKIRVGYGKGTPSKVLWVDGIDPSLTDTSLKSYFSKYGVVIRLGINRPTYTAMVQFNTMDEARDALDGVKGTYIGNSQSKIMADFANRDAKAAFFTRLENPGGLPRSSYHQMYPPGGPPSLMQPPHPLDGYYGYGGFPMESDYFGYSTYGSSPFPRPYDRHGYDKGSGGGGDFEDDLREFSRRREIERQKDREQQKRKREDRSSSEEGESTDRSPERRRESLKSKNKRRHSDGNKSDDSLLSKEKPTRGKERKMGSASKVNEDRSKGFTTSSSNRRKEREGRDKEREKEVERKKEEKEKKQKQEGQNNDREDIEIEQQMNTKTDEIKSKENETQNNLKDSNESIITDNTTDTELLTNDGEIDNKGEDICPVKEKVTTPPPVVREKPKVIITYEDQEEEGESGMIDSYLPQEESDDILLAPVTSPLIEQEGLLEKNGDLMNIDTDTPMETATSDGKKEREEEEEEEETIDESCLLDPSDNRPKVSMFWKEREKPLTKLISAGPGEKEKIESDFSSGDEFNHQENEGESSNAVIVVAKPTTEEHISSTKETTISSKDKQSSHFKKRDKKASEHRQKHSHRHDDRNTRRHTPSPHRHRPHEQSRRRLPSSPSHHGNSPPRRRSRSPRPRSPLSPPVSKNRRSRSHSPSRPHRRNSPRMYRRSPRPQIPPTSHQRRSSPSCPRTPSSPSRSRRPRPSTPPNSHSSRRSSRTPPISRRRSRTPPIQRRHHRSPVDRYSKSHASPPKRRRSRTPTHLTRGNRDSSPISGRGHHPEAPPISRHRSNSPQVKLKRHLKNPKTPTSPNKNKDHETPPINNEVPSINNETSNQVEEPHPLSPPTPLRDEPSLQEDFVDLLHKYPVLWQGHLSLKNEVTVLQFHFLSGNDSLVRISLSPPEGEGIANFRISQRMRLEQTQIDGVEKRLQNKNDHCLLLGLPCGQDVTDIQKQTHTLQNSIIAYLLSKQAAGIINIPTEQSTHVLHIFPPCPFSQMHLSRVAPDLLSLLSDNCHLMILLAVT